MPKAKKQLPLFPPNRGKHPKETLEQLLRRLKIPDAEWDLLLVGDGSGSKWGYGIGWGCVSIEKHHEEEPRVWFGAANNGTVNLAEMFAYIPPLTWYAAQVAHERRHYVGLPMHRRVHILTDSQYCQGMGSTCDALIKANGPLWQIFRIFQRDGIFLHWHWRQRDDVALNVYADALSKAARIKFAAANPQKAVEQSPDGRVRHLREYNPWE